MKKRIIGFITLLFCLAAPLNVSAQTYDEVITNFHSLTDTMSNEKKEMAYSIIEEDLIKQVYESYEEGMYQEALKKIDSLQKFRKKITGKELMPRIYMIKAQVLFALQEFSQLVETTKECIKFHAETMTDRESSYIYNMNANGYRNQEKYKKAISPYEYALSSYTKLGEIYNQANTLCNIAYCYQEIGKTMTANSYYEKGLNKYLLYFNVTKEYLLHNTLSVPDSIEEKNLALKSFALNLFAMAYAAQKSGDYTARKDYLKMSANCGYDYAKSEYDRLYPY